MLQLPRPAHMPCERCGASIDTRAAFWHLCDGERWLDFKLFELRGEIASLEDGFGLWLATPCGRFEQFYAERERKRKRPTID